MSVIDNLITDREEGTFYNYTDVNRVNEAIIYLAGLLTDAGYPTTPASELQTNWTREAHYYIEDADKVSAALKLVKNRLSANLAGSFPGSFQNLNYTGANQIEQFLYNTDRLLAELKEEWVEHQSGSYEQTGGALLL